MKLRLTRKQSLSVFIGRKFYAANYTPLDPDAWTLQSWALSGPVSGLRTTREHAETMAFGMNITDGEPTKEDIDHAHVASEGWAHDLDSTPKHPMHENHPLYGLVEEV